MTTDTFSSVREVFQDAKNFSEQNRESVTNLSPTLIYYLPPDTFDAVMKDLVFSKPHDGQSRPSQPKMSLGEFVARQLSADPVYRPPQTMVYITSPITDIGVNELLAYAPETPYWVEFGYTDNAGQRYTRRYERTNRYDPANRGSWTVSTTTMDPRPPDYFHPHNRTPF